MLLDRYRQLLTAYVDGELSSRQRRLVLRLLNRSAEARQLLEQLKADARALRRLPRPSLPTDFSIPVLRLIAERNLIPSWHRTIKPGLTAVSKGPLASLAIAAAVLLALGVASYFYFVASLEPSPKTEIAQTRQGQPDPTPPLEEPGLPVPAPDDDIQPSPGKPALPNIDPPVAVNPPKVVLHNGEKTKSDSGNRSPRLPKEETALTERLETFLLHRVPDLLPAVFKLSDLDRPVARKKLLAELRKDNAFRLELPCPNGTKAFERVQNAARSLHIGLVIDKPAQERIKLKWRISYLLYIENIMPEELIEFVRQIDKEDHKSSSGKSGEAQFDHLVSIPMNAGHRKELAAFLGTDPTTADPNASGSLGVDPRTPLADATARQIGQSLIGQGGVPRPGSEKPPDYLALVLAYNPVRASPGSEEIKHFLEGRKPLRAGALRVILVLRGS